MHKFTPKTIHLFKICNVLHRESIPHALNRCKLCIANSSIWETDFMILKCITGIGKRDQGEHIRMSNNFEYWFTNGCLGVESERLAHSRVYKLHHIVWIEDHHAVMNIVEYRFQPRPLRFRDLGT